MRSAAGGLLVMNEYERSSKTVTTAGTMLPVSDAVRSLYSLMNCPMLMPCGPSAVPTGGAAVALPALICTLTTALIFFAISLFHQLFDLQEVQLHRRLAAEDGHEDLHLVPLGVHLVDHAVEIGERPVSDADRLAFGERDLVLRRVQLDLPQDRADLTVGEWRRLVPAAHEARDAWRVAHDVPRVVAHDHLDEHIAREHLLLHRVPLAVLDLDLFLGGHENLEDLVAHVHRVDAMLEVRLHLVLVARIRVDHVPAPAGVDLLRCRRGRVDDLGLRLGDGNGNPSRLGLGDRPGPAKDLLRLVDRDLFYRLGRPEERTRPLGGRFAPELRAVDVIGGG